jgi:hypothetical protein
VATLAETNLLAVADPSAAIKEASDILTNCKILRFRTKFIMNVPAGYRNSGEVWSEIPFNIEMPNDCVNFGNDHDSPYFLFFREAPAGKYRLGHRSNPLEK